LEKILLEKPLQCPLLSTVVTKRRGMAFDRTALFEQTLKGAPLKGKIV